MGRIPPDVVVADKALALAALDDEVPALSFSSRKYIGRELTNTFPVR